MRRKRYAPVPRSGSVDREGVRYVRRPPAPANRPDDDGTTVWHRATSGGAPGDRYHKGLAVGDKDVVSHQGLEPAERRLITEGPMGPSAVISVQEAGQGSGSNE